SQTRRIHQLLNDLMQFARPPQPRKEWVNVPALLREVATALQELADERGVRLVVEATVGSEPSAIGVCADPRQLHHALSCLLRNAIEAASGGAEGGRWAGLRLETPAPDRLDLIVEDSGRGPALEERDHL